MSQYAGIGRTATVSFYVVAGPLMHTIVRQLVAYARYMGLDVKSEAVGNWWSRRTYISARGDSEAIKEYAAFCDDTLDRFKP